MHNRSQSTGVRASQRRRSKNEPRGTFGWKEKSIVISTIIALGSFGLSIYANIQADKLKTKQLVLEAKQFDLDVFTTTLGYVESYLESTETAVGYCSIIREVAARIPTDNIDSRRHIREMQETILTTDTRTLDTGLRPSDICLLNLMNPPTANQSLSDSLIKIATYKYRDNQNGPMPTAERIKAAISSAEIYSECAKIARLGQIEVIDTGQSIITVLRPPIGLEHVVRRIVEHNGLSLEIREGSPFTGLKFNTAEYFCQIDPSKIYTTVADISSVYVDEGGNRCSPWGATPPQDSTPP